MTKLIVLALGVAGVCVALLVSLHPITGEAGARNDAAERTSAPARDLATDAPPTTPHLPRSRFPGESAEETDDVPTVPMPTTDSEADAMIAEQRVERAALREQIRAELERQPRDPVWANQIESAVETSLQRAGVSARLESAECRSTLCAVVMTHPNSDAQVETMNAMAGAPGFRLAGRAHLERDADGRYVTHVFLRRDRDRFAAN